MQLAASAVRQHETCARCTYSSSVAYAKRHVVQSLLPKVCCILPPQELLPFLPQDEAGGADPAAEEVVHLTGQDLQRLLAVPDGDFWAAAADNASLAVCLDSYLQNCRSVQQPRGEIDACLGVDDAGICSLSSCLPACLQVEKLHAGCTGGCARRSTELQPFRLIMHSLN